MSSFNKKCLLIQLASIHQLNTRHTFFSTYIRLSSKDKSYIRTQKIRDWMKYDIKQLVHDWKTRYFLIFYLFIDYLDMV